MRGLLSWAFEQDLPLARKFVLVALADMADANGKCWPSQACLARRCGTSRETVNRHLGMLARAGLVRIIRRAKNTGKRASLYFLSPRAASQAAAPDVTQDHTRCDAGSHMSVTQDHIEPSSEPRKEPPKEEKKEPPLSGNESVTAREAPSWQPPEPPEPPDPRSARRGSAYRFEGRVIRLSQADFDQWAKRFSAIPDLSAELWGIDSWFAKYPERQAGWFHAIPGMLAKKHGEILIAERQEARAEARRRHSWQPGIG